MDPEHFRKLERMYLSANVNKMIYDTTSIHLEEGKAEIGLTVSDKFHHSLGAMHGSVYFKLLDDACFFAVNSMVTDYFVLTKSFEIQLKRPFSIGKITAKGTATEPGDKVWHARAELYNEAGKELGRGNGTFVLSKEPLNEQIGYR